MSADGKRLTGPVGGRPAGGSTQEQAQVDLDPSHRAVELVGGQDAGVDLAHRRRADVVRRVPRPGRRCGWGGGRGGSRPGCGPRRGGGRRPGHRQVRTASVASRPASTTARCSGSSGRRSPAGRRQEDVADLEQGDVGAAVVGVGDQGLQQPGQQRRAQDRLLRRQRVLDLDGLGGRPARARSSAARNEVAHASDSPAPTRMSATSRRSRW